MRGGREEGSGGSWGAEPVSSVSTWARARRSWRLQAGCDSASEPWVSSLFLPCLDSNPCSEDPSLMLLPECFVLILLLLGARIQWRASDSGHGRGGNQARSGKTFH